MRDARRGLRGREALARAIEIGHIPDMQLAKTMLPGTAAPRGAVLFLHGLLGNRANLRTLARRFVEAQPDLVAVLVDLREHGDSIGMPGEDTLARCARDLAELELDLPCVGAVGHSFGGKVAMRFAMDHPLERLVVLDSTPSPRALEGSEAKRVLGVLRRAADAMPDGFPSRQEFTRFVVSAGESAAIAEWLSMSLAALPDGRRALRAELDRVEALLDDYGRTDTWACLERGEVGRTVMVVGGRSRVVDTTDVERLRTLIERGRAIELRVLEQAGHWVHVDAPSDVQAVLNNLY